MRPIDSFLLAVVQGIAEWLPVSSSGHLVLLRHISGMESGISFDIFLHFSALFVILVFFRKDILLIFSGLRHPDRKAGEYKLVVCILAATAITGISGLLLRPFMESLATIDVLPFTFLITSALLFASKMAGENRKMTIGKACFIGLLQSLALLPGVSRSGATISAAKIAGIDNREAFRFSFLLAVPAIAGAIILERENLEMMPASVLITGFLTSFLLGLASLCLLKKLLIREKFYLFGFYTLLISILSFLL